MENATSTLVAIEQFRGSGEHACMRRKGKRFRIRWPGPPRNPNCLLGIRTDPEAGAALEGQSRSEEQGRRRRCNSRASAWNGARRGRKGTMSVASCRRWPQRSLDKPSHGLTDSHTRATLSLTLTARENKCVTESEWSGYYATLEY
jgi:hypothetical protein